jgi:integrase
MRGIRRAKGIAPNGKAPILTPLLLRMVAALPDDLSGLRDKAILLIGFAGAFRRSEIVGLLVRDVQISDAGLIITLRRSKTDQEGASFTKGIPVGTSEATCPKYALQSWLQLAGITSGPIFRPVDRWGHVGTRALDNIHNNRKVRYTVGDWPGHAR